MTGSQSIAKFCTVDPKLASSSMHASSAAEAVQLKRELGLRLELEAGRRGPPRRPRAGPASARRSRAGAGARGPGCASARASARLGVALHPAEDLGRGRDARRATRRAAPPAAASRGRARGEQVRRPRSSASSGPTRCEPQRSCSFARRLVVLVGADRDVLGAVVGGERAARAARAPRARPRAGRRRAPARRRRAASGGRRATATAVPAIEPSTRAALERAASPRAAPA